DLNDTWVFSYFSDKNVLTHIEFHYPKNAIDFIKATVEEQAEHATPHLPYMSAPFKKMRVDDFLPRPVDGHAAEMMENFELMADELEPEFLMSKRIEYDAFNVDSVCIQNKWEHAYALSCLCSGKDYNMSLLCNIRLLEERRRIYSQVFKQVKLVYKMERTSSMSHQRFLRFSVSRHFAVETAADQIGRS
ncbi:hypothetical protein AeNC1_018650, partial [Aphanomyces euteiches]